MQTSQGDLSLCLVTQLETDTWRLPLSALAPATTLGNSAAGRIVLPSWEICLFSLVAFNEARYGFLFKIYPVWYLFLCLSRKRK